MGSLWECTADIPPQLELTKDIQTDVAVIGGGMAGILTAYLLQERGIQTVVLEAETVACGQTKNTTAKITSQHGLIYDRLISQFGKERARQYANANQAAISEYERIIKANGISCDFTRLPAFVYSTAEPDSLLKELKAATELGLPAGFVDTVPLPFPITGAVRFEEQAQFHPLLFLKEMVKHITVYEHARVRSVDGGLVRTDGFKVQADHIVFACHYPFINTPGYYFMRMHQERSYVLALEDAEVVDGMYIGEAEGSISLRNHGSLLLFGGAGHRTGENSAGGRYAELVRTAKTYYPRAREAFRWSAQDCITHDGVPYIGQYAKDTPNWYVATGFMKWGMSTSMAAAMLLRDAIAGKENEHAEIFSPQRAMPISAVPPLVSDGGQAVKGLLREKLSPPRAVIDALPNGHGGIVEVDGEKAGVYKDDAGEAFIVDTKCTHLGCQLEWNPDERSWDCPCHGSRFDHTGRLLNGPAQEDIHDE